MVRHKSKLKMVAVLLVVILALVFPIYAKDIDLDDNESIDIPFGGHNASTPAGARVNLGVDKTTKCLWIEEPLDTDDLKSFFTPDYAIQFTKVWCESDQEVQLDLQIDDGSVADVVGTDIVCDAGIGSACASGCDTTIAGDSTMVASDRLDLAVASVSGGPTWVSVCYTYQRN